MPRVPTSPIPFDLFGTCCQRGRICIDLSFERESCLVLLFALLILCVLCVLATVILLMLESYSMLIDHIMPIVIFHVYLYHYLV